MAEDIKQIARGRTDKCPKCIGTGRVSVYLDSVGGSKPCPLCNGSGKNPDA